MRRHVNYANVVATLALVFAMTGGALAAKHYLIHSTKQISPKVLKALKGKRGPAGAPGATGATGKEGPQGKEGATGKEGKEGAAGKNGATTVVVREGSLVKVANGKTGVAEAQCHANERATGGGSSISGSSGWAVVESFPTPGSEGSTPTGWRVDATNNTGSEQNLVAIVVCASP